MSGSNGNSSNTVETPDSVQERANRMQRIVEDAISSRTPVDQAIEELRTLGASDAEVQDYIEQLQQNQARQGAAATGGAESEPSSGENQPPSRRSPGHGSHDGNDNTPRVDPVVEVAWAHIRDKLASLQQQTTQSSGLSLEDLSALLGLPSSTSSGSIPRAVLNAAPHLATPNSASSDAHLAETFRLKQLYASERAADPIVDLMQQQHLSEPLPRSIWKDILTDRYVNFEKVFAAMEPGYDHDDEPKEFAAGYALVRKEHVVARRKLRSEADWIRVFGAWMEGVKRLFPHRGTELENYREIIMELFRSMDATIAISVDRAAREHYHKSPFHLDDRTRLQVHIWAAVMQTSSQSTTLGKRPASSSPSTSKRASVLCLNWNFGRCDDPCRNRRKHGECSECGGRHRAKDESSCFAALQAHKGKGSISGGRGSSESSGRA